MQKREYQALTIPALSWDKEHTSCTLGKLVVQPLEPGFGITLGNALRRVMLAAIEGAAVTSVIINGVNNEFSTKKGLVEDLLQLVLNIKGIVIKNNDGLPGKMRLKVAGPGVVTVGDITCDENLELLNKDHILANLAEDGELEIEFFVEVGRGYRPAQWPVDVSLQTDSRIYIDSMFSPVKRVEYHVEKTRVGQKIDHDKLLMDIETTGAWTPAEILHYATSVLRTQFEHFMNVKEIDFNAISEVPEEVVEPEVSETMSPGGVPVDLFLKPIESLELSVRANNCLEGAGIKRVMDLVNVAEEDALKIKNFGRKSLKEVKEVLSGFGLKFGMNIKELDLKKVLQERANKDGEGS